MRDARAAAAGWLLGMLLALPGFTTGPQPPAGAPGAEAAGSATGSSPRSGDTVPGELLRVRIASIVHPVASQFLLEAIAEADAANAAALVVELDTPGGLMTSTREMTTAMLSARTPIVVWVAPEGAQAASAGFFLLQAADFAVMTPSSNTGAAHPVGAGGETIDGVMGKKVEEDAAATIRALAARKGRDVEAAASAVVESRSFTAAEALDAGLVDLVAGSLPELVAALDGRAFEKPPGVERELALAGRVVREIEMPFFQRFLSRIAHPNLAGILLTIGMLGIYFELSHPGTILPGVVGGICLLLALFALSVLPVNYVGVALIVLAVALFVAEVKVTSCGVLGVGGIIALVLGLAMLFRTPEPALRVSVSVIVTLAAVAAAVVAGAIVLVSRAFRNPVATGAEGLVGRRVVARSALAPAGRVFVEGEWWNAVAEAETEVAAGEPVEIVAVDGMTLRVRRAAERSS